MKSSSDSLMGNLASASEHMEVDGEPVTLESPVCETPKKTLRQSKEQQMVKLNNMAVQPTVVDLTRDVALEDSFASAVQCSICFEVLVEARILECSHVFCYVCIEKWHRQDPAYIYRGSNVPYKCPTCRQESRKVIRVPLVDTLIETYYDARQGEQADRWQLLDSHSKEKEILSRPMKRHELYCQLHGALHDAADLGMLVDFHRRAAELPPGLVGPLASVGTAEGASVNPERQVSTNALPVRPVQLARRTGSRLPPLTALRAQRVPMGMAQTTPTARVLARATRREVASTTVPTSPSLSIEPAAVVDQVTSNTTATEDVQGHRYALRPNADRRSRAARTTNR
ncbi:hypothetical protein HDE_13086 [Halotydeus destructor]|nr:hypothetical protein HDE_13086 [Halotydeus destructor]